MANQLRGKVKRRASVAVLAATIASGAVLVPASPGLALGSAGKACIVGYSANGSSNSSYAATTTPGVSKCGYARARAVYQLYPGSPIYYASWQQSSGTAISNPGNTVLNGNHSVTDPALGYSGNFPFST